MKNCLCEKEDRLFGDTANKYLENHLELVKRTSDGWTSLLKCKTCGLFWERNYQNGNGFYNGEIILRKLTKPEVDSKWLNSK